MYYAVHLLSESSDHYNYLLDVNGTEALVAELKRLCPDFAYISAAWITSGPNVEVSRADLGVLMNAVMAAHEEENPE